jgi:type II secretory pathway pseudopilin PulG
MNAAGQSSKKAGHAFTLIEVLVIVVVVCILAALLLPSISSPGVSQVARARLETAQIRQAIDSFHNTYDCYPVSDILLKDLGVATNDVTFGGAGLERVIGPGPWTGDNSEVITILIDLENRGTNRAANVEHRKNTQRLKFLNARMAFAINRPGIGTDFVYRDPWGSPYIITIDLNGDGKCKDVFYSRGRVSQEVGSTGFYGLANTSDAGGDGNNFLFNGNVMVWSLGPDKKADVNRPANAAPNKDNVLSWN